MDRSILWRATVQDRVHVFARFRREVVMMRSVELLGLHVLLPQER
jgi:hypothetical protein